jgi:hypothetical protein
MRSSWWDCPEADTRPGAVSTWNLKIVPISVSRDVPAPSVVHHRYVVDQQTINWNGLLSGADHCDVSVVSFLFGLTSMSLASV